MEKRLRIRRLHRWELESAAALMLRVYDESHFSPAERDAFAQGLSPAVFGSLFARKLLTGYGAWMDRELVGVLVLRENNHLSQLFVLPDRQRRGIGRQLVEAALGRQTGRVTVFAAHSSVGFYEKMGFVADPKRQDAHRQDTIPMVRPARETEKFRK